MAELTVKQLAAEIRRCIASEELLVPKLARALLAALDETRAELDAAISEGRLIHGEFKVAKREWDAHKARSDEAVEQVDLFRMERDQARVGVQQEAHALRQAEAEAQFQRERAENNILAHAAERDAARAALREIGAVVKRVAITPPKALGMIGEIAESALRSQGQQEGDTASDEEEDPTYRGQAAGDNAMTTDADDAGGTATATAETTRSRILKAISGPFDGTDGLSSQTLAWVIARIEEIPDGEADLKSEIAALNNTIDFMRIRVTEAIEPR